MPPLGHTWNPLTTETRAASNLQVHPKYDDELINLIVGNQIYRVSKILLSQSASFLAVLHSHSGGQLISLPSVSISELESFLEVLHARQTEASLSLHSSEWGDALYLATKWGFSTLRQHIIAEIEVQCDDQWPLDRFELALKCRVPSWLRPVYHTLCARKEHITVEESRRLGYEQLTAICRIREILREEVDSMDGRCGRCIRCISDGPPLTCGFPLEASGGDALQWIDQAEHLVVPLLEEEGIAIEVLASPIEVHFDERTSTIKEVIPVADIGDRSENTPSAAPMAGMETMHNQFVTATRINIDATRPPIPIVFNGSAHCMSAQREDMPSTIRAIRMGTTRNDSYPTSGTYAKITRHPTPPIITNSSEFSLQYTAPSRSMPSIVRAPQVTSVGGGMAESTPMTTTPLNAAQDKHSPIDRPHIKAIPGDANQGKNQNGIKQCLVCLKMKPKVKGKKQACEPCRGRVKCVSCLRFMAKLDEEQTCKRCRNRARAAARDVEIGAEAIVYYLAVTQKPSAILSATTAQSTKASRGAPDIDGTSEVVGLEPHHNSPFNLVVQQFISALPERRVGAAKNLKSAKGGKGKPRQPCVICKQLTTRTAGNTPKCKSCQHYTEVAVAAITGHLASSKRLVADTSLFKENATRISDSAAGIEKILAPMIPSRSRSEAPKIHSAMENEEANLGEWASDASSDSEDSAL
ncbi:hypothetical protein FRB94_013365 [Tulasnella sp. JGI-2019a]|nr:hypothetical protein FRB94_013365 [Tulasnella sp. JGI-2019a]